MVSTPRQQATTMRTALILGGLAVIACGLGGGWYLLRRTPVAPGVAAYRQGDWVTALNLAEKRVELAGDDHDALRVLARASARLGRHSVARATYAGLGQKELEAEDYLLIGLGWSQSGRPDAAMSAWKSALNVDPNHAETLNEMARLCMYQNHPIDAARAAERLSEQPGWEARGALLLGMVRALDKDPHGAADALRQAIQRDPAVRVAAPEPFSTQKLLARMLLQSGRPAEAREVLRPTMDAGTDVESFWLLSRAHLLEGNSTAADAALTRAGTYRSDHPLEAEPAQYVGESRCEGCHQEIYRDAHASEHSHTYRTVTQLADVPLPEGSLPDPDEPSVTHTFRRVGGRILFETRVTDRVFRAVVEYALGSSGRYASFVGRDADGKVRVLRISQYKDGEGSGWDRTKDQESRPGSAGDYLGKPYDTADGTNECLTCHTTTARSARQGTGPEAADHAIGCEGCHGPGGLHLAAEASRFKDASIICPPRTNPAAINSLCGRCHSQHLLEMPPSMADPAWARFPGSTLSQSRCYTESGGRLSCVDCHDSHRALETSSTYYEKICLSCHATSSSSGQSDPSRSTIRSPCPVNPQEGCVKCHMPKVPYVRLHNSFTDHYIRVHNPVEARRQLETPPAPSMGNSRGSH